LNRVVLITGASGGIGTATAQLFAHKGWHVIGIDKNKTEQASRVHHFISADIADTAAWKMISTEIAKEEEHIDALVNNAAIQLCKPLIETTPEEWDNVVASNLRSAYLSVRACHPLMRKRGGAIINISSVHAIATSANVAAYAASKGALTALTRALAIELAPDRIRVNSVLPGAVDTRMLQEGMGRGHLSGGSIKEMMDNLAGKTVIGRVGRPHEIAEAIYFLSDESTSSFITGQCLIVDGGATARLSTE
jgi:NAD(P)-dependent dehydrogenase (short-subunit alcohol dehydrogenase family)